jgi:peptidoglycan DL-endopeptidase CwlO
MALALPWYYRTSFDQRKAIRMKLNRRLNVVIFLTIAVLACAIIAPSSAFAVTSAEKKAEAAEIKTELLALNEKLEAAGEEYNNAVTAHEEATKKMEDCQDEIDAANKKIKQLQSRLENRISSMYRNGQISFLDVILGASSFSEFISLWDTYQEINESDAQLTADLKAQKKKLKTALAEYKEQEAKAAEQEKIMKEKKEEVEANRDALQAKLDTVNDEIKELIAEEEAAAAEAARIAAEEAAAAANRNSSSGGSSSSNNSSDDNVIYSGTTPKSQRAATVVNTAKSKIGCWYVWAAAGPNTFDCSGLVVYCYRKVGISLAHGSQPQYRAGTPISRSQLEPGDLVFFYGGNPYYNSHVGIYIGSGQFIHAPMTGSQVQISTLSSGYWSNVYVGACRIL